MFEMQKWIYRHVPNLVHTQSYTTAVFTAFLRNISIRNLSVSPLLFIDIILTQTVFPESCLQMFPRHILEHMIIPKETAGSVEQLASSHGNVTVMFMDIVGGSSSISDCKFL